MVSLVLIVASLLITGISTQMLQNQLDHQVDSALALVQAGLSTPNQRPGAGPGIPPGTIVVHQVDSDSAQGTVDVIAWRTARGGWEQLDSATAQQLFATSTTRRQKLTVDLPQGDYRVAAATKNNLKTVVGLPMRDLVEFRRRLLLLEGTLGLAAVVGSMFISGAVVRRTIRPLNQLADAATEVSRMDLSRGEVRLPVRVDVSTMKPQNEIAQVGDAFNHMINDIEEALSARQASETKVRQFVADASHELRNPLAAIRGYAELTRNRSEGLPQDTAHALGRIDAESARMSKLVNDLLLLARLDSSPEVDLSPTDMTEIVLNAVSDARAASPDHNWRLSVPDDPVLVAGEPDRLHQVIANLLSNARTHTPQGTSVLTSVSREGEDVVVRVIDDGPGIDPALQNVIFERFARGDASRAHSAAESTGLGLAIVAAVVGAHKGRTWLTSRQGHTEFSVAIPALIDTGETAPPQNPPVTSTGSKDTSSVPQQKQSPNQ